MKKKQIAPFSKWIKGHKLILKMKLTFFIMVICLMEVSASVYSQATKFSFNVQDKQVVDVLKEIESQSDFRFFYRREQVDVTPKVDLKVTGGTVEKVLEELFRGQDVTWQVLKDHLIVITPRGVPDIAQQSLTISGRVTDSSGAPLPGVTVVVKGTTQGTITDGYGNYTLPNVPSDATLVFSFVGMETKEIPVGGKSTINVTLAESTIGIEEVVAIGYGTMKKSDLTGAVASVKSEDINKTINNSFIDAMAGRAAGVQVLSGEGSPGGAVSMRIRGGTSISASNEPLYVIDGFPIIDEKEKSGTTSFANTTTNPLAGISPSDIESIHVLKDASATAIYGSRGANGVVIITTKSGKIGKASISYETYAGFKRLSKKLDVMDAVEYAQFRKIQYSGDPNSDIYKLFENPESYADSVSTDWQDEVYRQAYVQNHQLNINGGSKEIKYNVSMGYFKDQGIIKGSSFDRFTGRANLSGDLTKKLYFSSIFSASLTKQEGAPTGGANAERSGVVTQALFYPPVVPSYSEDPTDDLSGSQNYNPLSLIENISLQNTADRFMGNIALNYSITKNLALKTLFGVNVLNQQRGSYFSTKSGYGALFGGRAQIIDISSRGWVNENTVTYKKNYKKHNLVLLGGYTLQSSNTKILNVVNTFFDIEDLEFDNLSLGTSPQIPSSSVNEWSLMSGLGRINYNYDNRYLLTLSFRADGSSRFAEGNKWGYFPAAALAWRIANENFLKNSNLISDLKLRVGYGQTGNQEVKQYQSLSSLGIDYYSFGVDNGMATIAVNVDRVANPDLTWEVTKQYNAGLDLGFFKNRLTANIDVYSKKTTDLLLAVNLIPTSGIAAPALQNIGSLQNTGLEVGINSVNISRTKFEWRTNFNITFNRNEILDLGPYDQIFVDVQGGSHTVTNEVILKPGESIGTFYGYQTAGIYGLPENPTAEEKALAGKRIIVDQNGDNIINDKDRVVLGNALPKHYGGITNEFYYKGFDLSFFFNWSYGNKVYNANRVYLEEVTDDGRNKSPKILNGWTPENQSSDMPQIGKGETDRFIDIYVEDGSFVRLRNLSIGYTFPKNMLSKVPFNDIRIYLTGQNLFTITNYSGYNPESNVSSDPVTPGIDWGAYPLSRIYTMGINVKF